MRLHPVVIALCTSALLSACTNTDNPQLAMCQAVAKQLTGNQISSWEKTDHSDRGRNRIVEIAYGTANDQSGSIRCNYPIQEDGSVDTAPNQVVMNGQKVGTRQLLTAGASASAELLKGTAANTVAKSRELANEAGKVATDVARQGPGMQPLMPASPCKRNWNNNLLTYGCLTGKRIAARKSMTTRG